MTPRTIEQIRAALPTHIMLTPGVHRWRDGDEYARTENRYSPGKDSWQKLLNRNWYDKQVDEIARRPIPPHILDNQAWWLRYEYMQTHRLFTGLNTISQNRDTDDAIMAKGRLYDKWLVKQMEDV